jgi:signal transduction histidine kinase/CheY-like chemotaxis protein
VIWLFFNVFIALLLMEFGVFNALEKVLGLLSNVSIAWISTVAADLIINKPLGLSPKTVEFKRAYLPDLNPVGTLATLCASIISISAYLGLFGDYARAFSAFISLALAFALSPIFAKLYGRARYLTRNPVHNQQDETCQCSVCVNSFEQEDMAYCPYYEGSICSLCCSLDSNCIDMCKPGYRLVDYLKKIAENGLPKVWTVTYKLRLVRFSLLFVFLTILTSAFIGIIYYQDLLIAFNLLRQNFVKVYSSLLVFIGLCTWFLILNDESRQVAQDEISKQTERLLMEIAEHKLTDAKLKEATKAADRANIAKSRFLSTMSHEIRTPLNSIIGYAYILQKDPTIPVHRRQAVDIVKRSGEHLSSLIEDILDIARIESCKFEFHKDNIDFPSLIEHLCNLFKPQAEAKGLTFNCQIKNSLPLRVRGDEKRVRQIMINLLGNAVKFTSDGGVVFRIGYSCGVATFQVIDTGAGINEDQLDNIFQPFTQLANENLVSGSGLGLTISKVLTELMGGELAVGSSPGEGSTFTVRLYLANLGDGHEQTQQQDIVGYQGIRKKLLVVDDQAEHRQLIAALLNPIGFCVYEAASSLECLHLIREHSPDLILLDLAMPDVDGFQIAKLIRRDGFAKSIIVLSANAYATERINAINAGCNDFLAKPIDVPELFRKLKLHLGLVWIDSVDDLVISVDIPTSNDRPELTDSEVNGLINYVRIGDLIGLNQYLIELSQNRPQSQNFIQHIQILSTEYRLGDIKKLLNIRGGI